MMGAVVPPLILLFGIGAAGLSIAKLTFGLNVDFATLPGPLGFLDAPWGSGGWWSDHWSRCCCLAPQCGSAEFSSFLGLLHWPSDSGDLVHHGVSYLEVLLLFEQPAGPRSLREKVIRPHECAHRPISICSVPVSKGIEIRPRCRKDTFRVTCSFQARQRASNAKAMEKVASSPLLFPPPSLPLSPPLSRIGILDRVVCLLPCMPTR